MGITSLDGQQAVSSAQMEKESKLDNEKAQLEVKMHENEEYMKDKQEKVKKMAAELKAVQGQEATLQLEASKGHAKIKAAKAATAQDEAQLTLAKHTFDSQEQQVKYLQAQMEDAVKMGDQARVQALTPSIEQQKAYAEQAKVVLTSAAAATDEAKKAEVKASEIAVVNDELAKETLDQQVAAGEQAKIAAAQNVTAAKGAMQQAKATKERVIALLNDLQVASGGNLTAADKTQVQMLQNQTKAADEEVMNDELKLDVAKKEENTTAVDSSDKVLQATEATNMVNVDKELMSEKLESKEMKKDLDSAEKEEVAAKALGKEEEKTMKHEEEEIKNEEKEQKEDQEATKLVAAEKAEKVVVDKVEEESKKQKEEIKEEAKEEIQSVDEQDAAS